MTERPCGFPLFMMNPAGVALSARTCLISSRRSRQERRFVSHCQVIYYLLKSYASDDLVAEANADTFTYRHPQDLNAINYLHPQ